MKIRSVARNNRKHLFDVTAGGRRLAFPYAKARPAPSQADPVVRAWVDAEIAREGFSYELASGRSGTVHQEQVLDYNQDPTYRRIQLLYRLTVELQDRVGARHPVKADAGCRNTVFNALAQTGAEHVATLLELGVRHFRVEFLNESPELVTQAIGQYRKLLSGQVAGSSVWRELKLINQLGVTRGQVQKTDTAFRSRPTSHPQPSPIG